MSKIGKFIETDSRSVAVYGWEDWKVMVKSVRFLSGVVKAS